MDLPLISHCYTTEGFKEYDDANHTYYKENGPAVISYYSNGNIDDLYWSYTRKYNKKDKPTYFYFISGNIDCKIFSINATKHNETGPAQIWYNELGNVDLEHWYLQGDLLLSVNNITDLTNYIYANKDIYPQIYQRLIKEESINMFD